MTREDVKQQLAKHPLEWEEELGRPFYRLQSRVTLIDAEEGVDEEYDSLHIDFHIDINKADRSCIVDVSAHGRWGSGSYAIACSRGYIIPLEVLNAKAEDCRLSMACRLLGIKD